ncbi:Chitinase A1 precursor [compost metagenome]
MKDEYSNEADPTNQYLVPFFPCSTIQSGDSGSAAIQSTDWYNKDWLIYKNTAHNGDFKKYDINADEFSFNFLGHSGSFYYDGGKWVVVSEEHIVVEFNNDYIYPLEVKTLINSYNPTTGVVCDEVGRAFKSFTLITEDGNRYTFGGDDAIEFTSNYGPGNLNYSCSTWLLKKIENFKGEYVNFEYQRDYVTCSLGYFGNSISFADLSHGGDSAGSATTLVQDNLFGQYIFPVYLSKISTKNQTILFNSSVATTLRYTDNQLNQRITPNHSLFLVDYNLNLLQIKKLDKITIKDILNNEVKQINFGYNESTTQRFTLTNLYDGNSKNYSFAYNDVAGMPGLDGNNTDHWGFFNNIDILQSSLPTTFQKKESGPSYITKGLITSIKYPTGGYTKFTWEPNYYSKVVSQNRSSLTDKTGYAGGARIFSIENFDTNNSLLSQKKYYYVKNYNNTTKLNLGSLSSSGVLNGTPQYDFYVTNRPTVYNTTTVTLALRNYNSLTNFGYSSGSHIGYDEVVEVNKDDSYKKYYFTNFGADLNGISHYDQPPLMTLGWTTDDGPYMPSSSLDVERGKLIGAQDYNSSDICVKKVKSTFRNDVSRFDNYVRQIINSGSYSVTNYDALIFCSALKKYTYKYYPISNEETIYDINGLNPITTATEFKYNLQNQVVSEKTFNSKNETLENKKFYPFDLTLGVQSVAMQQLVNANRINVPVTTQVFNTNKKISEQSSKFTTDAIKTSGLLLPTAEYSLKGIGTIDIQKTDDKKITYDQYDSSGNLNQYTPQDGASVSIIWGYNKTQPIAKIENAAYSQVSPYVTNLQTLSDTGTEVNLLAALNSLRTNLPTSIVTTYTYIPLVGLSTITDSKGYTNYYSYDNSNRLQYIKDKDNNILQRYCYNYFGQLTNCTTASIPVTTYTNTAKNGTFTKQACAAGSAGSSYVYSVPAGTYSSTVSQADADTQAANEIAANGQNFANANGICVALPAVPTGLTFSSATASTINFSWTAVAGATSYKIYKDGVYVSTVTTTTGSLTGLTISTSYGVQVLASNTGDSALCASVSMSTLPAAPSGLALTSATATSINFSWIAVAGATSYKIYNGGSDTGITTTASSSSLSGLTASTLYSIQVLAVNASGISVLSTPVSMSTLPAVPAGLAVTSATPSVINFSWTAVAGATSYKIYKDGVYVSTVTTTSGSLSGLTISTAYGVQVLASNASGDGALSSSVSMTTLLAAPTNLALTGNTTSSINFTWTAVAGATGYKIFKDGDAAITTTAATGSFSGLTAATNYTIRVLAYNASGDGLSSSVQMATASVPTMLPAPTGLTLTSNTTSSINFSWTAVAGAAGYKIFKNGDAPISTTATSGSFSGLTAATNYTIRVLAYNAAGDGLSTSLVMSTVSPPAPIVGFHIVSGTYPATTGTSTSATIVNALTTPIYVYAVVQSLVASGVGSGGGAINGASLSVNATFTAAGQNFVSSSYATIAAGATVTFNGGYGGAVGRLLVAYSSTPGGTLNYWYVSNY